MDLIMGQALWRWVAASMDRETRLAGRLGGLLFVLGAVGVAVLLLVPGHSSEHELLTLPIVGGAVLYGVSAMTWLNWDRIPFGVLHVATLVSVPLSVVAAALTGGPRSPVALLLLFVVVWAACFTRGSVLAAYVLVVTGALAAPALYADGVSPVWALREVAVVLPVLTGVAVTIHLGRRGLDRVGAQLAEAAREQGALRHVATTVARGGDPDEVFAIVAEEAARVVGADAGAVIRLDAREGLVLGSWSEGSPRKAPGTRLHYASDPRAQMPERAREMGYASFAATSIRVDERDWGVIAVSCVAEDALPAGTEARLDEFGALVTTAIANAEHRAALATQASTDPLTGLANHRAFHERLGAEVARSQRHARAVSLAIIDVDEFKTVNDSAGHAAGDAVLVEVARALGDLTRTEDVLARIGGDEFAWLLPETGALEALAAIERARAAVVARTGVSLSAGICDLVHAEDADGLFRLADGALYWAKAHGRDAAWIYDPATVRELSAGERAEHLARSQALLGIRALARAIDAKDPTTREHSERVAQVACALAAERGWPGERVRLLEEAALVHDVGKIGISDAVLLKPGRLTDEEYEEIKGHAALSAQMVEDVLTPEQVSWVRGHHERPDGRGYPDGLAAAQITEGAALLALADAYDVMTAARPYSQPKPVAEALDECRRLVGAQFTADAVAALEATIGASADTLAA